VLLPILTFVGSGYHMALGGAKPVPVNPRLYRNVRRGDIIVSLAGIAANCVLAVLFTLLVVPVGVLGHAVPALSQFLAILQGMFVYGVTINLVLAAFNLIPIPPLDGSHVLTHLLPLSWALRYQQVGRYGIILLIAILSFARPVVNLWMSPVFALSDLALRAVAPFVLASPWPI
ncbi:MAG TPA: site-2 protease family protein, partial [Gemmatimonadaceae bacterium]|nr:site-2 protease family protein [Gemmatimonadaceae bacterium]